MNAVHLHLLLNHAPVIGLVIGLLLLVFAQIRQRAEVMRASLALLVGVAIVTAAVFLTGEPAEHAIENMTGVTEAAIEPHEEVAQLALISMVLLGALAIIGLAFLWSATRVPRWLGGVMIVAGIAVLSLIGWTSNLGARIHHPEVSGTAIGVSGEGHERGKGR